MRLYIQLIYESLVETAILVLYVLLLSATPISVPICAPMENHSLYKTVYVGDYTNTRSALNKTKQTVAVWAACSPFQCCSRVFSFSYTVCTKIMSTACLESIFQQVAAIFTLTEKVFIIIKEFSRHNLVLYLDRHYIFCLPAAKFRLDLDLDLDFMGVSRGTPLGCVRGYLLRVCGMNTEWHCMFSIMSSDNSTLTPNYHIAAQTRSLGPLFLHSQPHSFVCGCTNKWFSVPRNCC